MQKNNPQNCFLYTYNNKIRPILKEIDLYLKSSEPLTICKTAMLLNMTSKELKQAMVKNNINSLDAGAFINIMLNGNTYICRLLRRQLECGIKEKYSATDIAYIYDISYSKTLAAFNFLGIEMADTKTLPLIFIQIRD